MNLKQAVTRYFEPEAAKLGFRCTEKEEDWFVFRRKIGYAEDYVEIDKGEWNRNSLRISFAVHGSSISGTQLIGQGVHEWFEYENEAAIPRLLERFADILREQGTAWLDEHRPVLTPLEDNVLEKYRESVIEPFIAERGLELDDRGCLNMLDLQASERPIREKEIVAVAFVLGESLIRQLGGRWAYNELNEPCVSEIGGMPNLKRNVYSFARSYAQARHMMSLRDLFEAMANVVAGWEKSQRKGR